MDRVLRPGGVIAIAMQAFAPTIIDHPREEELSHIISKVNNKYFFLVLLLVIMKLLIHDWLYYGWNHIGFVWATYAIIKIWETPNDFV